MFDDLNGIPRDTTIACDVCIVGTGAAGLALSTELLPTGMKLVVLESGDVPHEPETQDLYRCVVPPGEHSFNGAMEGRFRVLGGSTTQWGGQSLRLGRLDFERRAWVAHSGWPIGLDELEPYYQRASAFILTDPHNFDTDIFQRLRFDPPAFDAHLVRYHFSKWSRRPSLRDTYGPPLRAAPNVTLLTHANVTQVELSADRSHVTNLRAQSLGGNSVTVRPRKLVLCTGGIETARILLANRIGNDRDLVGRFFQDHPGGVVATINVHNSDELQRLFNTFYKSGLKYAPRMSISEEAQKRHRVLNVSAYLRFETGDNSPYERVKNAVAGLRRGRIKLSAVRDVIGGLLLHCPSVMRPVYEYVFRHRAYAPDPQLQVHMMTEQEPNPDSRVMLSDSQVDALGVPRAELRWRFTDLALATVQAYTAILQREFERLGLGRIEPLAVFGAGDWRNALGDNYHHIGTARMSDDPSTGVVDSRCRVHGVDNLFIAGSAVFPTSGHSNPTLTLLALAFRMADDVKVAAKSR